MGQDLLGLPVVRVLRDRDSAALRDLLARTLHIGVVARDRLVRDRTGDGKPWAVSVWPLPGEAGHPQRLLVEIREATTEEATLGFQRDVAERMLLTALRERDEAAAAEASRQRATFIAAEGRRLSGSLDEIDTLAAISQSTIPRRAAWCIVDLLDTDGRITRLAMVHRDPQKQALLHAIEGQWVPTTNDAFGLPILLARGPTPVVDHQSPGATEVSPEIRSVLATLAPGPILTVPLMVGRHLVGAISFVGDSTDQSFGPEDIALAEALAQRSAAALSSARTFGEAVASRRKAETASEAKSAFLGSMSHELRTPLNAIGGYIELLEMGLHGSLTDDQLTDLARIKRNQRHLITLISDVLSFVKIDNEKVSYVISDVGVNAAIKAALELAVPPTLKAGPQLDFEGCDDSLTIQADPDRLTQILVNLVSNAMKFTPPSGRIRIDCRTAPGSAIISVSDTGIGIRREMHEAIFDPFVQVRSGLAGRDSGMGLGLAISRGLARGMHGDLTVESEPGAGSRFSLAMPLS